MCSSDEEDIPLRKPSYVKVARMLGLENIVIPNIEESPTIINNAELVNNDLDSNPISSPQLLRDTPLSPESQAAAFIEGSYIEPTFSSSNLRVNETNVGYNGDSAIEFVPLGTLISPGDNSDASINNINIIINTDLYFDSINKDI